jgi:hypothetical protein
VIFRYGIPGVSSGYVSSEVSSEQGHPEAFGSPPSDGDPQRWVDLMSEHEAKRLLVVRSLTTHRRRDSLRTPSRLGTLRCVEAKAVAGDRRQIRRRSTPYPERSQERRGIPGENGRARLASVGVRCGPWGVRPEECLGCGRTHQIVGEHSARPLFLVGLMCELGGCV